MTVARPTARTTAAAAPSSERCGPMRGASRTTAGSPAAVGAARRPVGADAAGHGIDDAAAPGPGSARPTARARPAGHASARAGRRCRPGPGGVDLASEVGDHFVVGHGPPPSSAAASSFSLRARCAQVTSTGRRHRVGAQMAEQAGQPAMGPEAARLHGAHRDGQLLGDLGVGQLAVVLQPDQLAVVVGQGVERAAYLPGVVDRLGRRRQAGQPGVVEVELVDVARTGGGGGCGDRCRWRRGRRWWPATARARGWGRRSAACCQACTNVCWVASSARLASPSTR